MKWQEHQHNNPTTSPIVQEGLDKLEVYRNRADIVPVYVLAMGVLYLSFMLPMVYGCLPVINPSMKLDWYEEKMLHRWQWAKDIFIDEVGVISAMSFS